MRRFPRGGFHPCFEKSFARGRSIITLSFTRWMHVPCTRANSVRHFSPCIPYVYLCSVTLTPFLSPHCTLLSSELIPFLKMTPPHLPSRRLCLQGPDCFLEVSPFLFSRSWFPFREASRGPVSFVKTPIATQDHDSLLEMSAPSGSWFHPSRCLWLWSLPFISAATFGSFEEL